MFFPTFPSLFFNLLYHSEIMHHSINAKVRKNASPGLKPVIFRPMLRERELNCMTWEREGVRGGRSGVEGEG